MANQKRISELPIINTLSGSAVSVIPVVVGGTTNQISAENFSKFVNLYNATTSSNNFIGNQTITGNLVVSGDLTAERYYIETISSSVIYESGSTEFGNSGDDVHTFTGSIVLNGTTIGLGELNAQTASQSSLNTSLGLTTGSINTTTSSFDSVFLGISSVTGSLNSLTGSYATTGSNTFIGNQAITGSLSISAGEFNVITGSGNVTSSLRFDHTQNNGVTLQLSHDNNTANADHTFNVNVWSAGVYTEFVRNGTPYSILNVEAFDDNKIYLYRDTRLYNKSLVIDNNLTVQNGVVIGSGSLLVNGVITGSILATNGVVSSSNQLFELNQQTGSQDLVNRGISSVTGSINTTTSSFNSVFSQIGSTTSSLIGITNGLMAFTAALDSTYATDAQLYQLYQATASVHFTTQSLNTQTGSQDLVNRGISSVTGSINTTTSSFNNVFLGISSVTGAMNNQSSSQDLVNLGISSVTGSLIGITNGLMAFTAALDTTYATDAQLYQLYQATASIHFTTQSLNTQTGSQDLVNLGISTFTGSLRSELDLIEAYTASLKAQAIVSSSQQIIDYNTFALTSSANVFFGKQSVSGALHVANGITGSFKGNLDGVASYTSTIAVVNTGTTTDTSLYPTFTLSPMLGSYTNLYSHASSSFFYNGVTRRLHMEGLVVSGSNNNVEISGSFNVSGSTNLTGSVTINESRIDNGWTAYTPEWTAASSNPSIGNGTIEGYYKVIGKTCFVRGNIAMGSTTTFGSGEWYVSMPFTASHADAILMSANLLDNGSGWYNATVAGARAGFNHKAPIQYQTAGGTAGDVNATAPFTWASTDRFMWNGSYEIA